MLPKNLYILIFWRETFSLGIHVDVTLAHNTQLNTVAHSYQQGIGTHSPFKFSRSQFNWVSPSLAWTNLSYIHQQCPSHRRISPEVKAVLKIQEEPLLCWGSGLNAVGWCTLFSINCEFTVTHVNLLISLSFFVELAGTGRKFRLHKEMPGDLVEQVIHWSGGWWFNPWLTCLSSLQFKVFLGKIRNAQCIHWSVSAFLMVTFYFYLFIF